jgi:hypothetical protein
VLTTEEIRGQAFAETPVIIPYLPRHLRIVPLEPNGRRDPDRAAKTEHFDLWRAEMLIERARIRGAFDEHANVWTEGEAHQQDLRGKEIRKGTRQACMRDPLYFLCVFCLVFEPRTSRSTRAGLQPFIPFTIQCRLVRRFQWMLTQEGETADLIVSKSRDMGATWVSACFMLWGFLYLDPFIGKIVSRSESEVDKAHQIDAVMVRIVENLDKMQTYTPWILPPGFDLAKNRRELIIFRDDNLNNLHGEATKPGTTGRGGRATWALTDEAASILGLGEIAATLVNTTDHRVFVSTESNKFGEDFHEMQTEPGAQVFAMDWWKHPWHDEVWYQSIKSRMKDNARFAREVERDPFAGDTEFVYPQVKLLELAVGSFPFPPHGSQLGWDITLTIDPGRDDETCFHWLANDPVSGRWRLLETYTNSHKPPEFYASIVLGVEDPEFGYEYTDPDYRMIEWARKHPLPAKIVGDPAGAAKTTDNDHAKTWYGRFERYLATRGHELRSSRWDTAQQRKRDRDHATTYAPTKLKRYHPGVIYETKDDSRYITGRRAALQSLLPDLDFNDTPQVRRTLIALRELKFEQPTSIRPLVNERQSYSHTWRAHRAAALEYWAVAEEDRYLVRSRRRRVRKAA